MITISNYAERIGEIGIANLNPTLRDGHDFIVEASIDFTDWSFYEDPDLKEVVDLYLDKLNSFFSAKRDNKTSIVKDFYNTLDTYQKASLRNGKLADDKYRLAVTLGITLADLIAYDSSVRKTSKPKEKPTERKPKAKKEKKEKKEVHTNLVESIKEETKYIKRFVGLHNKIKTANAILGFIRALQKSIVQKLIRKTSPLAKEIRLMQEVLVDTYNKMGEVITIQLPDEDLAKLVNLAGGETVYPSINLIKRFIGLEGKPLDSKKLDNLLKAIEKAKDKKLVMEGDPYLDRVLSIEKELKKSKAGQVIKFPKEELNGLQGIVKVCGCKGNLGKIYKTGGKKLKPCKQKSYSDSKNRGTCSHNKGVKKDRGLSGVVTAEEMATATHDELTFHYPWDQLVKTPAKNFIMMLHGQPGSGKTTLLIKLVNYLATHHYDRVLYVTSEEFGASSMTKKVNALLPVRPDNLHFAGNLEEVNIRDYDLVVLDSINDMKLSLEDFKKMKAENFDTAFILVLQVTKGGQFRGGKDWEHLAQIAGEVDNGTISIYKNRFGFSDTDKGSMNFFDAA